MKKLITAMLALSLVLLVGCGDGDADGDAKGGDDSGDNSGDKSGDQLSKSVNTSILVLSFAFGENCLGEHVDLWDYNNPLV